ncbi:MAG: pyruvate, phosphate dikinase, partial [Candidatus Gracilibacteria bacterium]
VVEGTGGEFPKNPLQQLKMAIEAVFNSWNNERAKTYRKLHDITGLKGTAVNIQAMVFGNMGEGCGTGVAFTRNPSTGERELYGEFLINAQGEDVVAGIRTPQPILELESVNPEALEQLLAVRELLEAHYRDMQDIEFTIEKGKLFLLQTRNGKRTAGASVRIACDMVDEGLISKEEAILKVEAKQLNQLLHPQIKKTALREVLTKGLPASPGAACGKVVFTSERAIEMAERHEKVVLVRKETSPEDLSGMSIAEGILTARGGMTSHAAVVCRGMGKCCITGAKEIIVNESAKKILIGDTVVNEGDVLTLDGGTGEVMLGEMEMQKPEISGDFKRILEWADEVRTLKVRTNADTPHDCEVAIKFGAEGIGLCRTEHMFFEEDRIHLVRQMILAKSAEERKNPLEKLLEIQKSDFIGIFQVMKGLPMTIRLLDPPLHEFLPDKEEKIEELARDFNVSVSEIRDTINSLKEVNPMMGHRGVRLGVTFPDIYEMQVKAIAEAAIHVTADGTEVNVEIEIPLVFDVREFSYMRDLVKKTIEGYGKDIKFNYKIGTMIELPRACLIGDELAEVADFFSFGTNDLTQMTYGLSRDDMGKFIPEYIEKGILERDPAATIDKDGVGKLMKACVMLGRSVKRDLEIGICGEHGGDPESVWFCHEIGLDYVSCSPYRVPIARLAAAQAAIRGFSREKFLGRRKIVVWSIDWRCVSVLLSFCCIFRHGVGGTTSGIPDRQILKAVLRFVDKKMGGGIVATISFNLILGVSLGKSSLG